MANINLDPFQRGTIAVEQSNEALALSLVADPNPWEIEETVRLVNEIKLALGATTDPLVQNTLHQAENTLLHSLFRTV